MRRQISSDGLGLDLRDCSALLGRSSGYVLDVAISSFVNGPAFDPLSGFKEALTTSEINDGRREAVQGFVVTALIVGLIVKIDCCLGELLLGVANDAD